MDFAKKFSLVPVVVLLMHSNAHAEWYWGADRVEASKWVQLESLTGNTGDSLNQDEDAESGHKIYSGYKASESFSVELEYKDQMEFGVGNLFGGDTLWQGNEDQEELSTKAFLISGQSTINIDESKVLFLRGGLYNWDIKTTDLKFNDDLYVDRKGTDLFYSIGAAFDFSESFRVRTEWERFAVDDEDVDFISTEFQLTF